MRNLFLLILTFSFLNSSFSQIVIDNSMTPQQYVQNVLIGSGVTVSNVTFTGLSAQLGGFDGTGTNIGFAGGVVLSSGDVNSLVGTADDDPANEYYSAGDDDLLQVAQSVTTNPEAGFIDETNDAAILEFDFVPSSTVVSFNFVFGSDEYLTYVNSEFNDAFGFFVSGPGITGPYSSPAGFPNGSTNLALVPGSGNLPITISTIYPGMNAQYYVDNSTGTTNTLNGFTTPIPVSFNVYCDSLYHFKFAVADCQDAFLNTVVFLEQNSFTSPPVQLSIGSGTGNAQIIEGCPSDSAIVYFTRSVCSTALPFTVDYTLSGTATSGVDYTGLSGSITIPAGEDSVYAVVFSNADSNIEGTEYIIISYTYTNTNGDDVTQSLTLEIIEQQPINVDAGPDVTLHCEGGSTPLNANITGAVAPYTVLWSTGATTTGINTGPLDNGVYTYIVTASGGCPTLTDKDTVVVTMAQTLKIDSLLQYPASACASDGAVQAFASGYAPGGQPLNHWEAIGGSPSIDATVMENISAGFYVFTITDIYCSVKDTIQVQQTPPPSAGISASPTSGCDPLTVTFTNSSQNATTYHWDFGNSQTANTTDLSSQTQIYSNDAVIMLIASNNGSCPDTAFVSVAIAVCGCMDPGALNYNPLATVSSGNCTYPQATVEVPNVFTPDGDNVNDAFFLTTTNATNVHMIIINRWGNLMYESSGPNPAWDGKSGGKDAPTGVYFVNYTVEGAYNTIEGQGMVELFRK